MIQPVGKVMCQEQFYDDYDRERELIDAEYSQGDIDRREYHRLLRELEQDFRATENDRA